ncbi:MAG: hypothetical protein ABL903_21065 [Methylococcales bacterium]
MHKKLKLNFPRKNDGKFPCGVSRTKDNKFQARYANRHLGCFHTIEEASKAHTSAMLNAKVERRLKNTISA